ncbi:MAG: aminotransferase class I/II-fold pyridoxal phosphate-dependent enzyme [Bacteroidales bacterium]|nr:aminotransferase class I/II-fold pyridoxal phosphate-dependent enzyme [Bacteroidales bacterium]
MRKETNIMKIKAADRLQSVSEYYFSRKLKEIADMNAQGLDVINLGIGSPDMAPSQNTVETLVSESRKKDTHAYQSYVGIPALREAFAQWYQKYFHVSLNPGFEILPLMGSKEGIMHISMAFLNPGDGVLVPNPGYPAYAAVSRLVGADIKFYELKEENAWLPDLEVLQNMDLSEVKLMWVNYPNMPTGAKATKKLFQDLIDFGHKNNILIINDNPYSFILNEEHLSLLSIPEAMEVALEMNSLSKSHNMAGWRVGMVAGHQEYIQSVLKVKSNMDSGMFKPLQMAAAQALKEEEDWFAGINKVYKARQKHIFNMLDHLECSYDPNQTGMFVWAKIPAHCKGSENFSDKVLKESLVFMTPGFIFGSGGEDYIRLSLCAEEERLKEAESRIKKSFSKTEKAFQTTN